MTPASLHSVMLFSSSYGIKGMNKRWDESIMTLPLAWVHWTPIKTKLCNKPYVWQDTVLI